MAARLACLVLGASAFALSSCGASDGTSRPSTSKACHPAHSRTLAANRLVRVFAASSVVYGCSERTSRVTRLGRETICIGSPRAGPAAVAGELAAYGLETCGVDTGSSEVVVRRLSDRRVLRRARAVTGAVGPESYGSVRSIVVRSDGAVGWIAVASSIVGHGSSTEVHRADKHGAVKLDSGSAIDPLSLRLRAAAMSWRHGRATRSAKLD